MSTQIASPSIATVRFDQLAPYASARLFRCGDTADAVEPQVSRLITNLICKPEAAAIREILATGRGERDGILATVVVFKQVKPTRWSMGSPFLVDEDELVVCIYAHGFLAVSGPKRIRDGLARELAKSGSSLAQPVERELMEGFLAGGEHRGLWVRNIGPKSRNTLSSKALSGRDVNNTLTPATDCDNVATAVRVMLEGLSEEDAARLRSAVTGSLDEASVSVRKGSNWCDFEAVLTTVMRLLAQAQPMGLRRDPLAIPESDLSQVHTPRCVVPNEIAMVLDEDADPARAAAAAVLASCQWGDLVPVLPGTGFDIRVGPASGTVGNVRCTLRKVDHRIKPVWGFGAPVSGGDSDALTPIVDALREFPELVDVVFASGHTVTAGGSYRHGHMDRRYPGWEWLSFAGWDITREKPLVPPGTLLSLGGSDRSLFAWVVAHFGPLGYLLCDDGSNEAADFILLTDDLRLSLIHVKAAHAGDGRGVSTGAFHVVISQASKNLRFTEPTVLVAHLRNRQVAGCWYHGIWQPDPTEMLDLIDAYAADLANEVVIVQPHAKQSLTEAALTASNRTAAAVNQWRIETMIWSLHAVLSGRGTLRVIGADDSAAVSVSAPVSPATLAKPTARSRMIRLPESAPDPAITLAG